MGPEDKDYFSKQAAEYAKHRPLYPDALFAFLASLTPQHECALDGATGNGQAALGLATYYERVVATDISASQINGAFPHPRIQYKVGRVEDLGLPVHSVDLVTVAQALHWFSLDSFYAEVNRVVKSGGVIAVWCYTLNTIEPAVDAIVRRFHNEILGAYWPPERYHVMDGYRSLQFPFRETSPPNIEIETRWTMQDLLGYLRSWSATQRYIDKHGTNPLLLIERELELAWGAPGSQRTVLWPIHLRVGFVEASSS